MRQPTDAPRWRTGGGGEGGGASSRIVRASFMMAAKSSALSPLTIRRADHEALLETFCGGETHIAWPLSSASYHVLRTLGQGSFSTVFLAERSSAFEPVRTVALKVTPRYADPSRLPSREIEIMLALRNCPHATSIIEFFFVAVAGSTFHHVLVLDAYDCSLRELVCAEEACRHESRLHLARHCGRHLALALAYIHERHIIHRDVKACNVLCRLVHDQVGAEERPFCVLADWGAAKRFTDEPSHCHVYARHYRAPELFFGSSKCEYQANHMRTQPKPVARVLRPPHHPARRCTLGQCLRPTDVGRAPIYLLLHPLHITLSTSHFANSRCAHRHYCTRYLGVWLHTRRGVAFGILAARASMGAGGGARRGPRG